MLSTFWSVFDKTHAKELPILVGKNRCFSHISTSQQVQVLRAPLHPLPRTFADSASRCGDASLQSGAILSALQAMQSLLLAGFAVKIADSRVANFPHLFMTSKHMSN